MINTRCFIRAMGAALCMLLAGCGSNHLVYVQETSFGLNVSAGAEGPQKMSLGYDRDIYAIVPKKGRNEDAMSLFSVNNAEISGLRDMDISEFVAGGSPARKLARQAGAITELRKKVYGSEGGAK